MNTNYSLWYKVKQSKLKGSTLYIRGTNKNGYAERPQVLFDTSETVSPCWTGNWEIKKVVIKEDVKTS